MKPRTKIVCTLGPAVDSETRIRGLISAGMNVARLNCSHGDWTSKKRWIEWVRQHSPAVGPVGILADLQGPKFRIADLPGGKRDIGPGTEVTLGPNQGAEVPLRQPEILRTLKKGARVLLGDGDIELRVMSSDGGNYLCRAVSGGTVRSRQGVTVVGQSFECEVITKKDCGDIRAACEAGADIIALSYVHTASDVAKLRDEVGKHNVYVRLCAKIETRAALKNIEEIVAASDVVMVARGDLGLQMNIEEVPLAQKHIIAECRKQGKPVITATQMLESMMHAPRPTRAEATDVANAVLDGTDALMLSGETAAGEFPLESVAYMSRIASKAESLLPKYLRAPECDILRLSHTEALAQAVAALSDEVRPRAIVTPTTSGRTAILISKYRPCVPILCAAWNKKVQAQMALSWGVEAIAVELPRTTDEQIANAVNGFVLHKRLKGGDLVILSAGVPPGTAGNTNMILFHTVKT